MARTKDFDEDEVLKKAIHLFWDKGYNATSMQDLVDGLGISRSSLYDTFGDKRQLYLKALSTYQQQSGQVFCTLIKDAADAKTAIRHLLQYVAHTLQADDQRKGCFMLNAGVELANHDNAVNDIICQKEQEFEEVFLGVIKDGQTRKEIDNGKDARALARFLSNTVKGMQVSGRSVTDENYFNDIIDTALMVLD